MKEGWEYKKLGEVALYSTSRVSSSSLDETNYVGVDNLLKDRKGKTDSTVVPVEGNSIGYKCGDILVGNIRPYLKKIWLADNDGGASGDVLVIRANNHQELHSNFLYWVLSNDAFFEYNMLHSKGAKMPRGNKVDILKYIVPVPPLSEQQHIVEELDLLSSIIEKKKAQLNELDNLAQSLFYEMFGDPITNEKGWEVKQIGAVCNQINNIKWGTFSEEKSFKYIDLSSVDRNDRCIKNTILICKNDAPSRAKQVVMTGDVLFGTTRPMLKRVCVIKSEYNESICSTGFCVLRPIQEILKSEIVYHYLLTSSFYSYVEPLQSGANYPAVSDKIVKSFTIPIPPIDLQQQFASKIEAIEHQKELIKQSIKEVETLFNSRMDYYFN